MLTVLKPGSLNFLELSGPIEGLIYPTFSSQQAGIPLYTTMSCPPVELLKPIKECALVTLSLECQPAGTWSHHNLRAGMRTVQVQFYI